METSIEECGPETRTRARQVIIYDYMQSFAFFADIALELFNLQIKPQSIQEEVNYLMDVIVALYPDMYKEYKEPQILAEWYKRTKNPITKRHVMLHMYNTINNALNNAK